VSEFEANAKAALQVGTTGMPGALWFRSSADDSLPTHALVSTGIIDTSVPSCNHDAPGQHEACMRDVRIRCVWWVTIINHADSCGVFTFWLEEILRRGENVPGIFQSFQFSTRWKAPHHF
jgi:hypothetical protein